MFPILAVGAVLLAGAGVAAAVEKPSKKEGSAPARQDQPASRAVASPQSYIVTPIAGTYVQSGQALSMVEGVSKIIV